MAIKKFGFFLNKTGPFFRLAKIGMVLFVILGGLAGYSLGYRVEDPFHLSYFFLFLLGLSFISAGSFAYNQVQEVKQDGLMKRTKHRPLITGEISVKKGTHFSFFLILVGLLFLYKVNGVAFVLGLFSIVLYNGPYTLIWKRKWAYGAIPGALPGVGPVLIGYAASGAPFFSSENLYLFLILFLWQMPHFWAIAIRFKNDYSAADFPVLPVSKGKERTLFVMGLYLFAYVGVALAAPFFVNADWFYGVLVLPMSCMVLYQFFKFISSIQQRWITFFIWINSSLLVFLFSPILDKWSFLLTRSITR